MSIEEQLESLNKARELVRDDPNNYIQIIPGIVSVAQRPETQFRQWCANFFLECFTCNDLDNETKQQLALNCLDPLGLLIQETSEPGDWATVKTAISCCSCIYPLIFSYVCANSGEATVWAKISDLKTKILDKWELDAESVASKKVRFGIQAACTKFAQQVISVQSYCSRDPRMNRSQDTNSEDVSLALVPPGHPLIEPSTIEAQGLGLLDRMLSVFTESHVYAPTITCTLNALFPLLTSRPSSVPKILRSILSFDTTAKTVVPQTPNSAYTDLEIKFIERSLKLMLTHCIRKELAPKFTAQIHRYISNISEARASQNLKKRLGESADQTAGDKRPKLEETGAPAAAAAKPDMPVNSSTTVPAGPLSFSSLFNLISSNDLLASFDAKELPKDIAINIALTSIALASQTLLDNSIDIIRKRYQNLLETSQSSTVSKGGASLDASYDDDEDDLDAMVAAQSAQVEAGADYGEEDDEDKEASLLPASSFSLALPSKLSTDQRKVELGRVVDRLISYSSMSTTILSSGAAKANKGLNRVAVTDWNKDTWIIIASRLATRGACNSGSVEAKTVIRKHIFNYVVANFRERLEIIISWLTEEWFNEFGSGLASDNDKPEADESNSVYYLWASQVFDHIMPLIEADDTKGFIRLLSDLPQLNRSLINKMRSLCVDPLRAKIGFMAIRYLIKLKPPVKEFCLDLLEDLYKSDEDSRKVGGAILKTYRPKFIEEQDAVKVE
ncbi:RNA-processing protein PTA1 [Sugiyamaella lignohabitans]|uniref:RNA-processing protein PTA1 n=1 Tax=Sugiyamaella lignohabitans TaxID=796027 RepID=A0A167ENX5_9ASCO|nr:RNA-processing protein PTA1 [Sugiyamaella lignohabitans]ANB14298.1 RNA-processing protein PTA1 [Sugiyamaella lignohabitans]